MNREYQKMWEIQQEMLDQWLTFSRKMVQPINVEKKPRASGKKDKKVSTVSSTDWPKAMMEFYQHWMKDQEVAARKWWEAFGAMSGVPDPYFSGVDFTKAYKDGAKFWKAWADQAEQLWPSGKAGERPESKFPLLEGYSEWMTGLFNLWKPQGEHLASLGYDPEVINKYFSADALKEATKKLPTFNTTESWAAFLDKTDQGLDQYIEFLNDIDLPFDDMAAFWDHMLVRFTPLDNVPLFRLGNNIHHYLEILANPFHTIAGAPKLMRFQKLLRDIQFFYLSYALKDAGLRGKIFESSLAVMPETIRDFIETYEKSGEVPEGKAFMQHYIDHLDEHLKKLLASKDYGKLQNEVAKTGVTLKSKMDELMELSVEGLPLLTKSDEDDIAKEIETLRVKLRELSMKQKKGLGRKVLKEEALN